MTSERYEVRFQAAARRAVAERLPESVAAAVLEFCDAALALSPRRVGKPLFGPLAGCHGARRGTYRIVYRIDEQALVVEALDIEHRPDIYRRPLRQREVPQVGQATVVVTKGPSGAVTPSAANLTRTRRATWMWQPCCSRHMTATFVCPAARALARARARRGARRCRDVGTDYAAIVRSANYNVIIGETDKDVQARLAWIRAHLVKYIPENVADTQVRNLADGPLVGTPEQITQKLTQLRQLGMTYAIINLPEVAYDPSGLTLFTEKVAPALTA